MRILFADPSRDLVAIYEKLLAKSGYETVPAYDGLQALELLRKERFDAAVLREELPRYETRYLVRALGEMKIPSILLTENASGDDRSRLAFPFLPEDLEKRLEEVTRR